MIEEEKPKEEIKESEEPEIPEGKKMCPACNKLQNTQGFDNHVIACKKKQEKKEAASVNKVEDKLPPATTRQEKEDVKAMQEVTEEITQKQEAGQTFTPEQVVQYQQQMQPLVERQGLRNDVVMENMETQLQKAREKREGADDISFKDIISLKKIEMLGAKQSGEGQNFLALMQNQQSQQNQIFQMQMAAQEQSHQRDLQNQKQQSDFMIEQLRSTKEDSSTLGQLSEFKKLAEELNYSKGDESDMSKLIGDNIGNIPKIISSLAELKQSGSPQPQPPPPAPIISSPNNSLGGENSQGSPDHLSPLQGPTQEENPVQSIAPPHQKTADEMSQEELQTYAQKNYLEAGEETDNPILNQYLNIGPKNVAPPPKNE